jgi:hypothetical protein
LAATPLGAESFAPAALAATAGALSDALETTFVAGFAAAFAGAAWVGTLDLLGEADFIESLTD